MEGGTDFDGAKFAWRERGEGRCVVLLHGLSASRLAWEPQLEDLADRWRVLAWDQPGYGAAAPLRQPITFAALADAVAELVDELGCQRVHLVGHSFGGMVAQHAALAHPERVQSLALLSSSPAFGLDGTSPAEWRAARLAPLDAGQEPADFAHSVLSAIAGPDVSARALAGQRAAMARVGGVALRGSIDCLVTHDLRHRLGKLDLPTLVVVGEHDAETPVAYARELARAIRGARLEVVPGVGHLVHAEAPAAVNALLREHLERVEAREPAGARS